MGFLGGVGAQKRLLSPEFGFCYENLVWNEWEWNLVGVLKSSGPLDYIQEVKVGERVDVECGTMLMDVA